MKHDPTTSFFQGTLYDIQHTKGNPYETTVDGIVCDLAVNPHILAAHNFTKAKLCTVGESKEGSEGPLNL